MHKQNNKESNPVNSSAPCYFPATVTTIIAICSGLILAVGVVQADPKIEEWIYTFNKGDNLWNIAEKYLDGMRYWTKLQIINNVKRPRQMPPGTQIRIPLHWLKVEATEANVRNSLGNNTYTPEGNTNQLPLTKSTVLRAGDQIVISEDGNASLEFADGSLLHLAKSTELVLQRVNKFADSSLADTQSLLKNGRSEIKVKSRGTRFEIRTPAANTSVRGTNFRTSLDPKDSNISRVESITGQVGVSGAGHTTELRSGFGTSIIRGKPPQPPVRLLPAPRIKLPKAYSRKFPVAFKWTPITGAVAYRVQVIRANDQQTVMVDMVTESPAYSTNILKDANYILQLRAIDNNGLEGLEGVLAFELDAQPQPPAAISPGHDSVVRSKLPQFEWAQPINADHFHFQLSRDMDFDQTVIDIKGYSRAHLTPSNLEPATYFWRLSSIKNGEEGPFSHPLKFVFRPKPGAPEVSTEQEDTALIIRWSPAREGQSYRLQVAENDGFKTTVVDEQIGSPEWRMERPQAPVFFRVQVIDTDGFQGAWSIPQKILPPPLPWYYTVVPPLLIILIAL